MSKPDNSRGSLMALRPSLPRVAAVQTTPEMEERILGEAGKSTSTTVLTERHKDGRKDVSTTSLNEEQGTGATGISAGAGAALAPVAASNGASAGGRRKEPTVLMNAKIPYSLHSRLKRTAQFNDISMTDILIKAIEAEIGSRRYAVPPEHWGSDGPE